MNELPAAAAAIDPSTATTLAEYGVLVGRLIAACGLTRNDVARRADHMSSSTLHNLINGKAVSRSGTVPKVLKACHLPALLEARWQNKWLDLTTQKSQAGSQIVQEQLDKTERELADATGQITALRDEEVRLREKLAAEQQQTSALASERAERDHYIAELTIQLKYAQEEIIRTENQVRLLQEEREALEAANEALQAQLEIIKYEQDLRRVAEVQMAHAVEQRDEVGRALSRMQAEQVAEPSTTTSGAVAEQGGRKEPPLETTITVSEREFGLPYYLAVNFTWYCITCETGGTKPTVLCPHCRCSIEENYTKTIPLKELTRPKDEPKLWLRGKGNHDDPQMIRGDVLIHVTRRRRSQWVR
ncbi:hypothetical protein OG439_46320 [Amycolatopsis sp. NBC_01307]|uniref:hypothetical protein n=1 Tax=Amycolatopsis sp. NBC_01307 TaxID=2903561 RepID=UPI002E0D1574|nr:hypothetical protein OG439_46320 [Amycolatopsis sp. NBC_01307]